MVGSSGFTHLFSTGFGEGNTNVGKQRRTQSEDKCQKLTWSFVSGHTQA